MLNLPLIASRAAGACALALALWSPVQAAPVLQMSVVNSATGIDLTVSANDVVDLFAYQFTLNFNPSLLTAISGTEGAFLQSGGATLFDAGAIDNAAGAVSFTFGTLLGPVNGVSGSGDLATFSLAIAQGGLASFSFSDVQFLDSGLNDIGIESASLVTQVGQVPEPGSLWLAGIALLAVFGSRAKRPRTC